LFEHLCTGAVPMDGTVPMPEVYKRGGTGSDGQKFKKGDRKPDWIDVFEQAERYKGFRDNLGLKVIASDVGVIDTELNMKGLIDIVFQVPEEQWDSFVGIYLQNGDITPDDSKPEWEDCVFKDSDGVEHKGCVIVDLKFTGVIEDRWSPYGWDIETLSEKTNATVQAKTYHIITGQKLPFFFWLFSSKGDKDSVLIRVKMNSFGLEDFKEKANKARNEIIAKMRFGFKARPTIKGCFSCPLRDALYKFVPDPLADGGKRKEEVRPACDHQSKSPIPQAVFFGH